MCNLVIGHKQKNSSEYSQLTAVITRRGVITRAKSAATRLCSLTNAHKQTTFLHEEQTKLVSGAVPSPSLYFQRASSKIHFNTFVLQRFSTLVFPGNIFRLYLRQIFRFILTFTRINTSISNYSFCITFITLAIFLSMFDIALNECNSLSLFDDRINLLNALVELSRVKMSGRSSKKGRTVTKRHFNAKCTYSRDGARTVPGQRKG